MMYLPLSSIRIASPMEDVLPVRNPRLVLQSLNEDMIDLDDVVELCLSLEHTITILSR